MLNFPDLSENQSGSIWILLMEKNPDCSGHLSRSIWRDLHHSSANFYSLCCSIDREVSDCKLCWSLDSLQGVLQFVRFVSCKLIDSLINFIFNTYNQLTILAILLHVDVNFKISFNNLTTSEEYDIPLYPCEGSNVYWQCLHPTPGPAQMVQQRMRTGGYHNREYGLELSYHVARDGKHIIHPREGISCTFSFILHWTGPMKTHPNMVQWTMFGCVFNCCKGSNYMNTFL